MKVRLLGPALEEIAEAAMWFDVQRPGLGEEFSQAVDAILVRIEDNPLAFAKSEFASTDADIRFVVVHRFNYVIHFLIDPNDIAIISVAHGARQPGYWLRRSKRP